MMFVCDIFFFVGIFCHQTYGKPDRRERWMGVVSLQVSECFILFNVIVMSV